jgi:hypothetical protein
VVITVISISVVYNTTLNTHFYKLAKQNFGHKKIFVGLDYLWLAMLVRMFIDMFVHVFLVSTVIIALQLSNPSPAVEVTFLKGTVFDQIKGCLQNLT